MTQKLEATSHFHCEGFTIYAAVATEQADIDTFKKMSDDVQAFVSAMRDKYQPKKAEETTEQVAI